MRTQGSRLSEKFIGTLCSFPREKAFAEVTIPFSFVFATKKTSFPPARSISRRIAIITGFEILDVMSIYGLILNEKARHDNPLI